MPTLGEELKRRREERGITLNDISEATRIGTRFLKAIETDNFSILPGGIYTRNFIRSFADHVGMGEDEAMALYHQQVTGQSPDSGSQPSTAKRSPQPVEPPLRRVEPITYRQGAARTNWATVIIGIGIALFLGLIFLAVVKKLEQGSSSGPPESAASEPAQQSPPSPAPQADDSKPQAAATQQPEPEAPAADTLRVKLEAVEGDSYVRHQVDEAKPVAIILKQGEAMELPPAQDQIRLVYGNRLALKLTKNGREARFPDTLPKFSGQVVISRENLAAYFQ